MSKIKEWQNHKGIILDAKNGFDIMECVTCGFKHTIPLPTDKEMTRYYSEKFYEERPLIVDIIKEDLEWWRMVYAEQYEAFEKYLSIARRRILDIGCGLGFFLQLGKERGWKTSGIEPGQQACKYAKEHGIEIIKNVFNEKTAQRLGSFDVIYMHEVLEHVPHPIKFLKLCSKHIEPGGLLCIITPNDYNPFQQLLRNHLDYDPWWVSPPIHLNYFDFDSLSRLLCSIGFEILHKTATFPMELFLLMGENYIGNNQLGRNCHGKRKELELNLKHGGISGLKQFIYKNFSEQGVGREIIILARWGANN